MEGAKLDKYILEKFKLKKTLKDYVVTAYKPKMPEYKKKEKLSEAENAVAEEYMRLVFYITKIRRVFDAFQFSLENKLNIEGKVPKTREEVSDFLKKKFPKSINSLLREIFESKHYTLLKSISEVPPNTEFHYLGELDTMELEGYIEKFDILFKKYAGELMKS